MDKDQKEMLEIIMKYVEEGADNHTIDEYEVENEIDNIIEQIEVLAVRIESGEFEETPPDEDDRGCEKYHQKKDDDMEKEMI